MTGEVAKDRAVVAGIINLFLYDHSKEHSGTTASEPDYKEAAQPCQQDFLLLSPLLVRDVSFAGVSA
jgi:hypothetical protein